MASLLGSGFFFSKIVFISDTSSGVIPILRKNFWAIAEIDIFCNKKAARALKMVHFFDREHT